MLFRSRLHVIVGDSNMSEYTTFLKVGAAACMLRMLESRSVVLRDMTLENPIRAIRDISHDLTCCRTVRLANGREVSALDIQREYLDRALRFAALEGFPPEEQRALEMWEHTVTMLESDPMKLDTEIDWVIKLNLLESFRERHGLSLGDPRVQALDLQYHDITRSRSPFHRLQDRGLVARVCDDAAIEDARGEMAAREGLLLCPEGAATYAALRQELASGRISRDERVVLFNCGSGLKYPMPPADASLNKDGEIDYAAL